MPLMASRRLRGPPRLGNLRRFARYRVRREAGDRAAHPIPPTGKNGTSREKKREREGGGENEKESKRESERKRAKEAARARKREERRTLFSVDRIHLRERKSETGNAGRSPRSGLYVRPLDRRDRSAD